MITPEYLDRLTRLCEAATRGPWEKHGDTIALFNSRGPTKTIAESCYGEDAAFIAAAREAMPALIAKVRKLAAERDFARKEHDAIVREDTKHWRKQNDRADAAEAALLNQTQLSASLVEALARALTKAEGGDE